MTKSVSVTEVTTSIYTLLEPLGSDERQKCLRAALVLLGEDSATSRPETPQGDRSGSGAGSESMTDAAQLSPKLKQFLTRHRLSQHHLDQIYHAEDGTVELIASDIPGNTKKERTVNCYLLVGVRGLVENDEARFDDKEALEFCQLTGAYDRNNHTANRNALGNRVSGDRRTGISLTVPGLRDAAKLIREMAGE